MKHAWAAILLATNLTLPTVWPFESGGIGSSRAMAQPAPIDAPAETPPPPATAPARKSLKLMQPLTGVIQLENTDIDASAVARVFDINDGKTSSIKLINCTITGATSVIEGWADGLVVEWRNVTVGQCKRYGIYLESRDPRTRKPITDRISNAVRLYNCEFGSSENETPVRLMFGVTADIQDSNFIDTVDIGGNKANIGLRLHCHSVYLARSKTTGIKLGHGTHKAKRIECVDMDFSRGHFAMEGCETKPIYTDCKWPSQ